MPPAARITCSLVLWLVLFSPCMSTARAGLPFISADQRGVINLGRNLDLMPDTTGRITLADILTPDYQNRFTPNNNDGLVYRPGYKALWVRLELSGSSDGILLMSGAIVERVDLYRPAPLNPGQYQVSTTGKNYPPSNREINFRCIGFSISESQGIYYLRLQSVGPEVFALRLFSASAFQSHAMYDYFGYGLIYGAMFCMILYNLFICISLKEYIYLIYVAYILSFLLFFLIYNGQAGLVVNLGNGLAPVLEWGLLGASIFLASTFCRLFFNTPQYTPIWDRVMYAFQVVALIIMFLGLARHNDLAAMLANVTGLAGPINLIVIGFLRHRQGFAPAKYYILANLFMILGTFIYIAWLMNIVPFRISGELLFTLGPALESVFLSFALADRIRILERQKNYLVKSRAKYKQASQTDGLTGLFNKKYLQDKLAAEIRDGGNRPLCFIIMDVDDFKAYNDTFGHPEGDQVLQALAEIIRTCIRSGDLGCRYGGEEFAVILPDTDLENAVMVAERIRGVFAGRVFGPDPGREASSSISVGVARHRPGENREELVARADKALYLAKKQGKDRVIRAD